MKRHRLAGFFLVLAAGLGSGCGSLTLRASAGMGPMVDSFPFQASRPAARELRYTYMSLIVLDGKEHKRIVSADEATRARGSVTPRAVFESATASAARASDELSRQARELEKRGGDRKTIAAMHGSAASFGAAENSLARAQAGVGLMSAYFDFLSSLQQAGQWLQDASAARLAEWVRRNTGAVGPAAPPGSVLQLDFLFVNSGKAYGIDSRSDFVVNATLLDGRGRRIAGKAGYELYTFAGTSTIEIPADAIAVQPGIVAPEKQPLIRELSGDPFSWQLALAASFAIADLYRQLPAR